MDRNEERENQRKVKEQGMDFAKKEYAFLKEIDISSRNLGCHVNGKGKANGHVISTVKPANNQVPEFPSNLFFYCEVEDERWRRNSNCS
ncbi:aldehyde dehydrogenase family 7 member B4-like [Spinacia oleracea]|uniref:Aldehyde dehydrogenase family 7 member B4-like n=1 Tax=Spinacia oleracea TaxID=3562 RepID=A0A9R0JL49_SPIOL|nr:aldehyde dehydrogenase family 7 member B4-like [Spinacia oleracea]